jgi:hypothetical protein
LLRLYKLLSALFAKYAEIPHGKLTHPAQLIPFQVPPVPQEVLNTNGYETSMDGKGQVGLGRNRGYSVYILSLFQLHSGVEEEAQVHESLQI